MTGRSPPTERVDVAVIGAGTAGINARLAARRAGAEVALFDPGPLGTTCARVGCMPSKLLIAAAERAHEIAEAGTFGLEASVRVDPVAVMERVRRLRDGFVAKTVAGLERGGLIRAAARFVGPLCIEAAGRRYEAGAVVLATGSRPVIPGPWRAAGEAVITTDQVFELPRLPRSMLVVGAGPIGLELGQAMQRLGVRVAVLDIAGTLAGLRDPAAAGLARELLGLDMHLRHELRSVERVAGGVRVRFVGEDGEERDDTWEIVLAAAGRAPRLEGLDLAAAGLDPLPPIDPVSGRLGDSRVFLAGDVTGDRPLMHEAAHEGATAGALAAGAAPPLYRKVPLALIFTDPQIAVVGSRGPLLGAMDFAHQTRAMVLGRAAGRLEISALEDGTLSGATVIGPGAEHLGHLLAWAIQSGMSVEQALEMPFYHPTLEEAIQSALRRLLRQVKR